MKALLVAEYREEQLLGSIDELMGCARQLQAETSIFLVGSQDASPKYGCKVYLADAGKHQEYNPDGHKQLLLKAIETEQPDLIIFCHSSYGWDLAPRIAHHLNIPQISEVVGLDGAEFIVPVCNAKLRRKVRSLSNGAVITLQSGAFTPAESDGTPEIVSIDLDSESRLQFERYEVADAGGVDITKAEVVVSAGRGIGKPENISLISDLAETLGGEYGASRPVVDAEWVDHFRQVGTTGQSVAPKLYIACGISGAIQHLAGMKKSEFVVAINTDKDAPIGEIADVLVVADLKEFVPTLTEKLKAR